MTGHRIAFVGLGAMGRPMAARLVRAGHHVAAHDRDPSALELIDADARPALVDDPRTAVDGAAVVILVLPDGRIVDDVLFGPDGVADVLTAGQLVVDMGSSDPSGTRDRARRLEARGIALVDAPVSGGVAGATAGTLTIMVGSRGEPSPVLRELLRHLGSRIVWTGPVGSAHAMKALNNYLSAVSLLATSEAVVIGRRFGLEPERMIDIFNGSSGRSYATEWKFPEFILGGSYDSGFSAMLMAKDIGIASDVSRSLRLTTPVLDRCRAVWSAAAEELGREADHTEIYRWAESAAEHAPVSQEPTR